MAEKTTTTKAPTKQDIQNELNETKDALKEAMELIAQLKEQVQATPQVTVVQQQDKRPNAKIKCISLSHCPLNVATRPNAHGRVFEFKDYGQAIYIKYDELLDIISSYPNTMASGLLYITDKEFCEEQGLYDDMGKVYTKDMIDEIVRMRDDIDVELLGGMSKDMLEDVIMEIAKRYNAHEEIEANKIAEIKKRYNYDIVEIADKINLNVDKEDVE